MVQRRYFGRQTSLCPSRLGKSNIQEPSLHFHIKINQLDFLIISLQHSGCTAKLGWSTDFVFPPVCTGTSKTGYNIPPLVTAARASSFVKTDTKSGQRAKTSGSHSVLILLSRFSASQIAKACNKMSLRSHVRSKGHLESNAEEMWCHGATSHAKRKETSRKTKLTGKVQGNSSTLYPAWLLIKNTSESTY